MAKSVKKEFQAATDIIWSLATHGPTTAQHNAEPYIDVIAKMYPGINYYSITGLHSVINKFVTADVKKLHPEMEKYSTDTEAVAALGPTVEMRQVKPCKGYAWGDWNDGPQLKS